MVRPAPLRSVLLAATLFVGASAPAALAQTTVNTVPVSLTAPAETSSYSVDYRPIGVFTEAFGDQERGRTKIAYAALEQQGKRFLTRYVDYLAGVPVSSLDRDDQLAFWLNTRNILIVQAMAESNSRRRMQRARGTAEAPGSMWTEKRISFGDTELSIEDIEKDIILANWSDTPNVIFGLYQGTQGGAGLPAEGFRGETVHAELAATGKTFINARSGVRARRNSVEIPELFYWYNDAFFGGDEAAMTAHLATLAEGDRAEALTSGRQTKARKFSYRSDELIIRQQSVPTAGGAGGFAGGGGAGGGS